MSHVSVAGSWRYVTSIVCNKYINVTDSMFSVCLKNDVSYYLNSSYGIFFIIILFRKWETVIVMIIPVHASSVRWIWYWQSWQRIELPQYLLYLWLCCFCGTEDH